ncbi:11315_t:CDS:2 [Racocetra fulgida]|uniref:11315_t:CDS:1 n=1 Tax=Racocetra fulgida TaxID=60492 RepID=A0A9N8V8G0_9GLOM|nr:11315_t:CDS:2 [Racocetra fulgida]
MLTPKTLKKLQNEQKKLDGFIVQKNNITDNFETGKKKSLNDLEIKERDEEKLAKRKEELILIKEKAKKYIEKMSNSFLNEIEVEKNKTKVIKEKKIEQLEKELTIFVGKLERIRSNRISLEAIRGLIINCQGEKKPLKAIGNLRISPAHELVVRAFEPKFIPLISKTILDKQLGYKLERSTKEEVYFTLTPFTKEIKERLITEVKLITEEGKKEFRLIHQEIKNWLKKTSNLSQDQKKNYEKQGDKLVKDYQDKLLGAEEKKIKELNS